MQSVNLLHPYTLYTFSAQDLIQNTSYTIRTLTPRFQFHFEILLSFRKLRSLLRKLAFYFENSLSTSKTRFPLHSAPIVAQRMHKTTPPASSTIYHTNRCCNSTLPVRLQSVPTLFIYPTTSGFTTSPLARRAWGA